MLIGVRYAIICFSKLFAIILELDRINKIAPDSQDFLAPTLPRWSAY